MICYPNLVFANVACSAPMLFRRFVNEHRRGAQDWSMQIWQFLTLEFWMQTFLDGSAKKHATDWAGSTSA